MAENAQAINTEAQELENLVNNSSSRQFDEAYKLVDEAAPMEVDTTLSTEEDKDLGIPEIEPGVDSAPTANEAIFQPYSSLDAYMNADEEISENDIKKLEEGYYDGQIKSRETPIINPATPEDTDEDTLGDYAAAIRQGLWDAGEQAGFTVTSVADWVANKLDNNLDSYTREDPNAFRNWAETIEFQNPKDEQANLARLDTFGKQLTKTAAQFLTGFIPIFSGVKAISLGQKIGSKTKNVLTKLTGGGASGVLTDFTVFDVADARAVDFATQFGAELEAKEYLKNPNATTFEKFKGKVGEALTSDIVKKLKYDPNTDSEIMGRTKQAIEGMIIGAALEPVFGMIGALGKFKKKKITTENPELPAEPAPLQFKETTLTNKEQTSFDAALAAKDLNSAQEIIGSKIDESLSQMLDADGIYNVLDEVDELVNTAYTKAQRSWNKAADIAGPVYSKVDPADPTKRIVALQDEALDASGKLKDGYQRELKGGLDRTQGLDIDEFKRGVIDQAVGKKWLKAAEAYKSGAITDEMFEQITGTAYAVEMVAGSSTGNIARALNQRRLFTKDGSVNLKKLTKGVKEKGYNSNSELADYLLAIGKEGNNKDVAKAALGLDRGNWRDFMVETFINSVLSTTSLGVNLTSNLMMLVARTADIHGAAFKNKKLIDENGLVTNTGVSARQAWGHSMAYLGALGDAFKVMYRSYKKDVPEFSGTIENNLSGRYYNEFQPNPAITSEKMGFVDVDGKGLSTPKKIWNRTLDVYGKILRGQPGAVRSMMATDEFFKLLHYRAELRRYAIESAEKHGLDPVKNVAEYNKHVQDILDNAQNAKQGQKYSQISRMAMDDAHEATFTSKFSESGEKLYKSIRAFPEISFILPFVRQPTNNLKWYVRRTPGLNLVSSRLAREIEAGGARADIARTQIQIGHMLWVSAIGYAFMNPDIKGSSKTEPAARKEDSDLGISKYTQKDANGNYIYYRGGEPIAPMFATAASVIQQWMKLINESGKDMSDREISDASEEMMMQGALSMLDTFKDGSAVRGPEQLLQLLDAAQNGDWGDKAAYIVAGITSVFAGNIKYLNEKYFGHDVQYDKNNVGDIYQSRYGGGDIVKLNMFGNPMPVNKPINLGEVFTGNDTMDWTNPVDYLNVIPTNIRKTKSPFNTPAEKEVIRLKEELPGETVLGSVPREVEGVKIDGNERHNLLVFNKNFKDEDGYNLDQGLQAIIDSEEYKEATPKDKARRLGQYYQNRMLVSKLILLADSYAVQKGLPRTLAKGLDLRPYDRSTTLSEVALKKKARKINRLIPLNSDERINIQELISEYEEDLSSEMSEFESLLQNN